MLFYRKKILLAILEAFGRPIEGVKFQKYLFLISQKRNRKYYRFIPYKYGCFSFESYNDKRSLIKAKYLAEGTEKWVLTKNDNFLSAIDPKDKEAIWAVKKECGKLSRNALLSKIYSSYPYYAINSEIISQVGLSVQEHKKISDRKPGQTEPCLFTIGYEGRSIDEYLNLLIKNNIKLLCDVRKNPISRKYGFSKQSLQKKITELNMEYLHIPELGIHAHLRKGLETKEDYKKLFSLYARETLPVRKNELLEIVRHLEGKKRVALTCFEAEPSLCHRHCISSFLKRKNNHLNIEHL